MNKVIVIGGFHHNTYGLIRSLGEAGIKSYVILEPCHPKMNWLFVSKYIIGNYILSEGENLVDYLLTTFSNEKVKPIIYCGSDTSISLLDNAYDVLKEKFFIFNHTTVIHWYNRIFLVPVRYVKLYRSKSTFRIIGF